MNSWTPTAYRWYLECEIIKLFDNGGESDYTAEEYKSLESNLDEEDIRKMFF